MADETPDNTPRSQPRERHSLTLEQRRALRRWANSQSVRPSHKDCIAWFQSQYNQTISQSTVSHSLSPKYARLDADPGLTGSRLRFGNWPDVEKLVQLWHQQMVNSGRNPSNEELAEKAKSIFTQLPRYKDETPPEFSPGWIHRFKKRYGLLIRRQRPRSTPQQPLAEDTSYLVDAVPRFMAVSSDTNPATIRDTVQHILGVDPSLGTCARVRDEIVYRLENPHHQPEQHNGSHVAGQSDAQQPNGDNSATYADDDPEMVLQNALRALQQDEVQADADFAASRESRERDRVDRGLPQSYAQQAAAGALSTPVNATPVNANQAGVGARGQGPYGSQDQDLSLTPIQSSGAPIPMTPDRPVRCPFCVNTRMLRTIKEAVEHLSTHVVV